MTPGAERICVTVPPEAAGQRLDVFLSQIDDIDEPEATAPSHVVGLGDLSRSRLQRLIKDGDILLNETAARASQRLRDGDSIVVTIPPPKPVDVVAEAMDLDILFEDSDFIAVNKPAGLVVHPGAGHHNGTLVNGLLAHCGDLSGIGGVERPGIVHRLDAGTSGVMVIAKNDRAHEGLARQFAERSLQKTYVAFVIGEPKERAGRIETPFGRHPTQRKKFSGKVTHGKQAITAYRVERSIAGVARLEIALLTGRTHQIRVHLAEMGHPVAGDQLYGGGSNARVKDAELNRRVRALEHQALHAAILRLRHPVRDEALELIAPMPSDLAAIDARILELCAGG